MIITNIRIKGMRLFCKTCTMIKCSGIASQRTSCWTAKATSASQISVSPLNIICNLSNLYFEKKFNIISSYMNMNIYDISYIDRHFSRSCGRDPWGRGSEGPCGHGGGHLYLYSVTFVFVLYGICICILWHFFLYFVTFVLVFYDICIFMLWRMYLYYIL